MGKPSAFKLTPVGMEVNAVWYYNLVTDGKFKKTQFEGCGVWCCCFSQHYDCFSDLHIQIIQIIGSKGTSKAQIRGTDQ